MDADTDTDSTSKRDAKAGENGLTSRPIADLFPETTIIFCDIVGFTGNKKQSAYSEQPVLNPGTEFSLQTILLFLRTQPGARCVSPLKYFSC